MRLALEHKGDESDDNLVLGATPTRLKLHVLKWDGPRVCQVATVSLLYLIQEEDAELHVSKYNYHVLFKSSEG